jgi:hypothetical protein
MASVVTIHSWGKYCMKRISIVATYLAGLAVTSAGCAQGADVAPALTGPQILAKIDLSGTAETFVVRFVSEERSGHLGQQDVSKVVGVNASWAQPPVLYDLYGDGKLEQGPKPPPNKMGPSPVVVDKFVRGSPGLQAVTWHDWYSALPTAYLEMLSFERRGAPPREIWRSSPLEASVYETLTLAVDANNDGQKDLVTATHERVFVTDGATGKKIMEVRPPYHRNYGVFGYAFIKGDPFPKFFTLVDFQSHFDVYGNDGKALKVLWRQDVTNPDILRNDKLVHFGPHPLTDLFGDGNKQLVFNYYNRTGDNQWHVMGYDLLTGKIVLDIPRAYLAGAIDLNQDGHEKLLVTTTDGLKYHAPGELRIYGNSEGKMEAIWSLADAQWVTRTVTPDANIVTMATEGKVAVLVGDFTGKGIPSFFAIRKDPDGRRLLGYTVPHRGPIEPCLDALFANATGLAVTGTAQLDASKAMALRINSLSYAPLNEVLADQAVEKMASGAIAGQLPSAILAQRTKGPPVIAVPTLSREYVGLEFVPSGGTGAKGPSLREIWRRDGWGAWSNDGTTSTLLAPDLDGAGGSSIVAAGMGPDGEAMVQACDAEGVTKWTKTFPDFDGNPPVANVGGLTSYFAGRFNDPKRFDVLVGLRRGAMHSDEGHMLDGRTGEERWSLASIRVVKGRTYEFLGSGAAVADVDGDGMDEIATSYPCDLGVVKGTTGAQTVGVETLKWTYYAQPLAGDFLHTGKAQILVTAGILDSNIQRMLFDGMGSEIWRDCVGPQPKAWIDPTLGAANPSMTVLMNIDGKGTPAILAISRKWDSIRVLDPRTGKDRFTLKSDLTFVPTEYKVVDLYGDGKNELLCINWRQLAAVSVQGQEMKMLWTFSFPVPIKTPVVGDLAGDGRREIVVSGANGSLFVLAQPTDERSHGALGP